MKPYKKIYIVLALILYPVIFYSKVGNMECWSELLIPIFVTLVLAFVIANYISGNNKSIWLIAAFFFVLIGDYLINLTPYGKFSALSFALTHGCLSVFYIVNTGFKSNQLKWLPISLIISILSVILSWNSFTDTSLLVVFICYLCILSFMFWRALSYLSTTLSHTIKTLVITGSLFFLLTDIFVCMQVLYPAQKIFVILTWLLYPPALVMLSLLKKEESEINIK